MTSDTLVIANRTFSSRLIVGTGKYSSPAVMVRPVSPGADVAAVYINDWRLV